MMDAAPSGNRHTALAAMLIALTLLFLFGGCASPTGMAGDPAASPELPNRLVGTWIRPINNQPDKIEGIRFDDDDGRFGLVGIHTMHGLTWMREDDDLIVTTNTGRYPEPFETRLSIETLTDTTLILGGDKGYFRGAWRRDDTSAARITGQVAYRERIALPPDAAIHLTLEDVSQQDAPATYIASQVIPTLGRQVPIPFALYYASEDIDPRHTYQVRAAIVIDGQRRFMTTQAYPVLTRGNPDHIEMTVQGVQPKQPLSTQPHRKALREEDLHLPATYSGQLQHPGGYQGLITLNLVQDGVQPVGLPIALKRLGNAVGCLPAPRHGVLDRA